jgi:VIT1/CCC1 family predicted Fe2+/Mn2+ transporter
VSRVVYGSIIGLALVVALEAHPPPAATVVASLLGTAVAVALAELYSELVGLETTKHRTARAGELRHVSADIVAVALGIAFPALFFLLAALGAFEGETAFTVAKWTGLGLIGVYGYAGARLSGAGIGRSCLQAAAVALIGAALIVLKSLVH